MEGFYRKYFGYKKSAVCLDICQDYNDEMLYKGEYTPERPLKVRVSKGTKYYDVLRFQDVFNFAISKNLYEALMSLDLTGWSVYDVEIEESDVVYYGFQVLGRCGKIWDKSEKGIEFDPAGWDGSDFFIPEDILMTLFTEKARRVFCLKSWTNIDYGRIEDIE